MKTRQWLLNTYQCLVCHEIFWRDSILLEGMFLYLSKKSLLSDGLCINYLE